MGKCISCLRENFLIQHVEVPTRARGIQNPHTLDLVITNEHFTIRAVGAGATVTTVVMGFSMTTVVTFWFKVATYAIRDMIYAYTR